MNYQHRLSQCKPERALLQKLIPLLGSDKDGEIVAAARAIGRTLQAEGLQLSEHVDVVDGTTLFRHACVMGLEGIVAKRRDRPYRSGRSADWIKVKNPNAPAVARLLEE